MAEWRTIPSEPRYKVSSDGLVQFAGSSQPRKPYICTRGYQYVGYLCDGKRRTRTIHRMVAEAFLGSCPEGCEVRHLDGNPSNNSLSNLAYGTKRENAADREAHGRTARGEKNGNAKLSDALASEIRDAYAAGGLTQYDLAHRYGISQAQVNNIVLHKQRIMERAPVDEVPA